MTPPTTRPTVTPTPGLLMREPVRVYLYGVALTVATALVLFGIITDDVAEFVGVAALQLLGLATIAEPVRASVYSQASMSSAAQRTARAVLLQTGSVEAAAIVRDLDPVGRHAA